MPSGMPQEHKIRKIVGSRIMRAIPAFEDSVMYNEQRMSMDAGLFHGRTFRVGWGPGHTLVHCGAPLQAQLSSKFILYRSSQFIYHFQSRDIRCGPVSA